jgi:large subunit ribosomal protein L3
LAGKQAAVTAIQAGSCLVAQVKERERDGYEAVQLGFGERRRLNAAEEGHLRDIGKVGHLREFRGEDVSSIKRGDTVDVGFLKAGDRVNVSGVSKGRGFAGVVKRYHFRGGPKTHGQSDRHRAPGSIGATTSPGRVLKGKKMAGHMGHERVTTRNLEVVEVDVERNLLLVRGSVPGVAGGLLFVRKVEA